RRTLSINMSVPEQCNQAAGPPKPSEETRSPSDVQQVLSPPTRNQNITAITLTIFFLAVVGIGGRALYLHTHRGGAQSPGGMIVGRGAGGPGSPATPPAFPVIEINNITVEFAGVLRKGNSE